MIRSEVIKIIDTCRDILVGKIPDPITQVEQITIALIYKFMNDMDQECVEMGGVASFFCKSENKNEIDFSKYSWQNILDTRNGAYEMLQLYSEGITKIKENQNVPDLFKQILKDAYLPYNDPRILGLFLKEINKISYEDSESLGEAFEYLLSIMGSQGEAGQFRTPRHIIDFIVKIINPQKGESILDPACGTAGFLISAFKYIREQSNNILTSEEKENLSKNLVGYDIAPTMERLSKVNLYLHHLENPQVYQYDTLSDDTYWENKFNIILANPPFMTPKGGIKPHNKFTLKSNRSEALFCDYINSHLKPNGRAGFIVPEGIVFKSDKAYKELRKSLIEESLIAVISLPSGIFNPYSGVKTDILILDKKLHKQTDKILFITIENDGYSLGAQRKPIQINDLPQALEIINLFKESILNDNISEQQSCNIKNKSLPSLRGDVNKVDRGELNKLQNNKQLLQNNKNSTPPSGKPDTSPQSREGLESLPSLRGDVNEVDRGELIKLQNNKQLLQNNKNTLLINREEILNTDDYNLSINRYKKEEKISSEWEMVELGEVVDYEQPTKYIVNDTFYNNNYKTPVLTAGQTFILGYTNETDNIFEEKLPVIIFDDFTTDIKYVDFPFKVKSSAIKILHINNKKANIKYIYNIMKNIKFNHETHKRYWISEYSKIQIPLPPLEIQEKIVKEIEEYEKIINGCKEVVENWKPKFEIKEEWEKVELGNKTLFKIESGGTPNSENNEYWDNGNVNWITLVDLPDENNINIINSSVRKITTKGLNSSSAKLLPINTIVVSSRATIGRVGILKKETSTNQGFKNIILLTNNFIPEFVAYYMLSKKEELLLKSSGGTFKEISKANFETIQIPLPQLEEQEEIVAKIEEEEKYIDGCKKMIEIYRDKIKKVIDGVVNGNGKN